MNLNWRTACCQVNRRAVLKFLMVMKLVFVLLTIACLQVTAKSYGQLLSVNARNKPLTSLFKQIQKETGYRFFWEGDEISKMKASVEIKNATLEEALAQLFTGLPLSYTVSAKTIVVQRRELTFFDRIKSIFSAVDVRVVIKDEKGQPLPGATISIKGSEYEKGAISDASGSYTFSKVPEGAYTVVVTMVGLTPFQKTVTIDAVHHEVNITLASASASLSEVVVVGYGTQQKASVTSSLETVSAKQIENRPVPSLLNILQGQAPGLNIQQTDANPGYGSTQIDIRGNSTLSNNPVLFIVDGMAVSGIDYLNPSDIESVTVLKDA
jgi:hypothetical protein